jgi:hypothetical protein
MILGRAVCPKALEDAICCRPEPPEPAPIEIGAVSRNAHAILLKLVPEGPMKVAHHFSGGWAFS